LNVARQKMQNQSSSWPLSPHSPLPIPPSYPCRLADLPTCRLADLPTCRQSLHSHDFFDNSPELHHSAPR
jgi:hypothetical protein